MGNCLAGDTCVFSHDPASLINNLNIENGNATNGTPPTQGIYPSFQLQDNDAFPTLQPAAFNQWAQGSASPNQYTSYNYAGSQGSRAYMAQLNGPGFDSRTSSSGLNESSSPRSPRSHSSRPNSRHSSRAPTPSIPAVDDTEAFPSLGSASIKGIKKHHGKRGGHGHSHNAKENVPSSLADVVRMSPSPAPSLLRKGLMKSRSYSGIENSAAANAIRPPEHIPWLETGEKANQAYIRARQDAFKHGGLRNKFLQRSVLPLRSL